MFAAALLLACSPLCFAPKSAHAADSETLLHSFGDDGNPFDPNCTLAEDASGNFYGTDLIGGSGNEGGTFKLPANGSIDFTNNFPADDSEGWEPAGPVTLDSSGSMYGVAVAGAGNQQGYVPGYGTLFAVRASGELDVLHTFAGGSDGSAAGAPILAQDGMLYGASSHTLYRINPDGTDYQILYDFSANDEADGSGTHSPLTQAPNGTFYGTCFYGGPDDYGTLFKFQAPARGTSGYGTLTALHFFNDGSVANDGEYPFSYSAVQLDAAGNLYGTTSSGSMVQNGTQQSGIVYKYSATGKYSIVYQFASGVSIGAGVLLGSDGNLYGPIDYVSDGDSGNDPGDVYKLTPGGTYTQLYHFLTNGQYDAENPTNQLMEDNDGNMVGASNRGGGGDNPNDREVNSNGGCIYKIWTRLVRLSTLTTSVASITPGSSTTGTVTLNAPARQAGSTITLTSSDTKAATVPATVYIAPGKTSATFPITAAASATTSSVTIKASYNGQSLSTTLAVAAPTLKSVTLSPTSVQGGTAATTANRVYLTAAPAANASVALTSSNTAVATVPSTLTIDSGSTSHTFTVTTKAVTSAQTVTITASYNGSTQTATLTVTPPQATAGLKSVTLSPTSTEGGSAPTTANRVYWNGNAPANETVTLASSNTAVATVPSSVTISSGSSSHAFTITTKAVTSQQTVTITATSGGVTQTATLTVTP